MKPSELKNLIKILIYPTLPNFQVYKLKAEITNNHLCHSPSFDTFNYRVEIDCEQWGFGNRDAYFNTNRNT